MSTGGALLFFVASVFAIGGAVATVALRNPLRAAMALLIHIIALAGIFLTLHAHLLAALQLLVYAGAVVVLFVFVIMLIGPEAEVTQKEERLSGGTLLRFVSAAVMSVVTLAIAGALVKTAAPYVDIPPCAEGAECGQFGGVVGLGTVIYQEAFVPFELISILLTVAIIGAIAVARGRTPEEVADARKRKAEIEEAAAKEKAEAEKLSAEVAAHGGH